MQLLRQRTLSATSVDQLGQDLITAEQEQSRLSQNKTEFKSWRRL